MTEATVADEIHEICETKMLKPLMLWKLKSLADCYNITIAGLKRLLEMNGNIKDTDIVSQKLVRSYVLMIIGEDQQEDLSEAIPFGSLPDWLQLIEGYVRLSTGIPHTYIEAYEHLKSKSAPVK